MEIKNVATNTVIPYARNPRQNQGAIAKVAASIKEFGWQQPIVVDSEMVIIAGHTRLSAAQSLDLTEVPVFIANDLTPLQVKAYRIADNRVSEESEWDEELLTLELKDLMSSDFNISITGFDQDDLESLNQSLQLSPPEEFNSFDENLKTEHECPKCKYRWSGKNGTT
jgi:ParB-like chromosome segregation protein Spo0J